MGWVMMECGKNSNPSIHIIILTLFGDSQPIKTCLDSAVVSLWETLLSFVERVCPVGWHFHESILLNTAGEILRLEPPQFDVFPYAIVKTWMTRVIVQFWGDDLMIHV